MIDQPMPRRMMTEAQLEAYIRNRSIWRKQVVKTLKKRDGDKCLWCQRKLSWRTATLDHLICRTHGGSDWPGNLALACRRCNNKRGQMTIEEWLKEMPRLRIRPNQELVAKALSRSKDKLAQASHFELHQKRRSEEEQARLTERGLLLTGAIA
jgi:5-methylcytosine-specific restriction endonuclease McrA